MPLPEHVTPVGSSRRGQAPYNFVPLPEAIFHPETEPFRQHDRLDPERLHGFIELTITTETELYTRCAYPPDQEKQTVQQSRPRQAFYHLGDERRPVIPGSSLRGMTRALVEILAYSRLTRRSGEGDAARILDEKLVHRAVADQNTPTGQAYNERFLKRIKNMQFDYPNDRVQAGYLEAGQTAGEWRIRPARKLNGVSFVRVKLDTLSRHGFSTTKENDVEDVWVKPEPKKPYPHRGGLILHYARTESLAARTASPAAPAGMEPGKLIYSGRMGSRHMHTVIYEKDTKATPIPIPEAMWEQFCEDRDQQRGIPCRRILQPGDPLFYLLDPSGKLEFIGPTLFFRLPYKNYTGDYAPQFTVDADGPLDLVEAIFGTVNGEPQDDKPQTGSHKSRVRFDDAEWVGSGSPFLEGEDGIRWPAVLSAPKPTSYQNYLVQSDADGQREKLLSYSAPPPDSGGPTTTALRGFKLYWHRGRPDEKELQIDQPKKSLKQYTVIRPVKSGMEFSGRVRFENLSKLELGALLAALELPADYRHHLGMGKPLGMGSVRIQAVTTLYDPVKRYQSLAADGRLEQADQDGKLADAREAFRKAIVQHLNTKVPASTVPDNTGLWAIPRLRTLGMLLDWENQPTREKTAYLPNPKQFRDRQVLPTPAGVLGQPEPAPPAPATGSPPPTTQTRPPVEQDWISSTPALKTLQAILQDNGRGQREQLEAIDDALLHQLAGLDEPRRQRAWTLIRGAIGVNRRTRERLRTIQQRLVGG
jgi:CRISPR-associated protein (TIGR03986 family)